MKSKLTGNSRNTRDRGARVASQGQISGAQKSKENGHSKSGNGNVETGMFMLPQELLISSKGRQMDKCMRDF